MTTTELSWLFSAYRDPYLARQMVARIRELAPPHQVILMHVCGTHEATVTHFGIRSLLPASVEVRSGPGCPVCITPPSYIEIACRIATLPNTILTTYGDMFRVPGINRSLAEVRAQGHDVRVVYSVWDAVKLAQKYPEKEVVHFAIGFETTAPTTAAIALSNPPPNFSFICVHRLIPPVMEHLLQLGELRIAGFICPGHVSTVIGAKPYRPIACKYRTPMVIAGFEPIDVLLGVLMLLKQLQEGRFDVEVEYTRAVLEDGNVKALRALSEVFDVTDGGWRGIGMVPNSALQFKKEFSHLDAFERFEIGEIPPYKPPPGCRCGEVLRGLAYPQECPLFNTVCTPNTPVGPCAVSREGACYIAMKYERRKGPTQ